MLKTFFAVFLAVLFAASLSLAAEFSADTISTFQGDKQLKGKLFFKVDRFRMEMKPHNDMSMVIITRLDKKVAWNLMPETKMYMEIPFDMKNKPKIDEKYEGEIERKEVGRETIDGHPTIKYLITYQVDNEKHQVYQWLATDIKMPVKTTAVDGSWGQELKNIKTGPQSDSLFEIPVGFQKMQMPQIPMMPGMPGGMKQMK
jgi:hypothetical protein